MTRIRATCPDCGEVDLRPEQISLEVSDGGLEDRSFYCFDCPACEGTVTKPADSRIVRLLSSGGVAVRRRGTATVRRPSHPENPPVGPSFTVDDLIDFHGLLSRKDWFDQLQAMVR